MTALRVVAAALLFASLPLRPLAADPTQAMGVLAVSDPPGPSAELVDLARAFRAALAQGYPGVVTADELRQRMVGRASTASLSELDRAYAGAVAALQAGDNERAARTLRAVIEDLERFPPSEEVFSSWSRAMLRLARAEGSLGRKGEAREVMERLVRADPTITADPELYPPSFARQLDEVRSEQRAKPRRKLAVNAGGRPARVFVEGRFAGEAPVTLSVAPASYRVTAVLGQARAPVVTVDLTLEDQTATLDFSLTETYRPDAGPGLAAPAAKRASVVVSAGAALNLDRVFSVALASDGDVRYLTGSVFDVSTGMLQREARVRLSGTAASPESLGALATFLVTGAPSTLVLTKPEAGPKPIAIKPDAPHGTLTRNQKILKWSPVATAGLAVVLGGVAIWQGLEANDSYDQANAMLVGGTLPAGTDPSVYDNLVSDGDAAKKNAQISGVTAGVALVGTAVLSYFSYKQTGEVGPFRF